MCHHKRAVLLYTESINSESGFWGYRCNTLMEYFAGKCKKTNWALFGEHAKPE